MSFIAFLFLYYATDLCYKHSFGTKKMSNLSASTILHHDDDFDGDEDEVDKLRRWLIANGYLCEYVSAHKVNYGWTSHRGLSYTTWTGVTPKGWAIARRYAELALRNAYELDNAGTDCYSEFDQYKSKYIEDRRIGWSLL